MRKTSQRGSVLLTFLLILGFSFMFGTAYFSGGSILGGINRAIYAIGEYFDQENPYHFKDLVENIQKAKNSDLPTGDIVITPANSRAYMLANADVEVPPGLHNWIYLGDGKNGYQVLWTGENLNKVSAGDRVKAIMAVNKDSDQYYVVYAYIGRNHRITINESENGLYEFNPEDGSGFPMALLEYRSKPVLLDEEAQSQDNSSLEKNLDSAKKMLTK